MLQHEDNNNPGGSAQEGAKEGSCLAMESNQQIISGFHGSEQKYETILEGLREGPECH